MEESVMGLLVSYKLVELVVEFCVGTKKNPWAMGMIDNGLYI